MSIVRGDGLFGEHYITATNKEGGYIKITYYGKEEEKDICLIEINNGSSEEIGSIDFIKSVYNIRERVERIDKVTWLSPENRESLKAFLLWVYNTHTGESLSYEDAFEEEEIR